MTTNLHDLSDLEYRKLNLILDEFSHNDVDCVINGFNDSYVYIAEGRDIYRMDRDKVSPNIDVKDAVKSIVFFERK